MLCNPSAASTRDKAMTARIGQLISRARLVLRREGRLALLRRAVLFLKERLCSYSSYNIYESALDPPDIKCRVDGLTIRVITRAEEIAQVESDQLAAEGFNFSRDKEIVDKGAILFYAFVDDRLAHVTQVLMGRKAHEIYPFSFAMPFGHTVGLAGFTAPDYRRRGIHLHTRVRTLHYLKEKGLSRAWDIQNKDNTAARKAVVKLGYYLSGEGHRLRLLSRFTLEWTRPKSRLGSRHTRCSLKRGKNRLPAS